MTRHFSTLSLAALSTALVFASPAQAQGKADRAHAAIAAAQAKIDAANKIDATGEVPRLQAEAAAMLRKAKEEVENGQKDEAIADANRAAMLADTAMGETQRAKALDQRAAASNANRATASAQADAAVANERAAAAERAATASAMDAERARNAPPPAPPVVFVTPPAPVTPPTTTMTVSTETAERPAPVAATRHVVRKRIVRHTVVRKSAPRTVVAKTTTTVKTEQN